MRKKRELVLLTIIIVVLLALNYSLIDNFLSKKLSNEKNIEIERVIDGDTVVDTNNIHYRMLGINTPEKGEYLYAEAKKFNEENTLNKSLTAEEKGTDLYGRTLAYLYDGDNNINLEIIRGGYAGYYFPEGKDAHYDEFAGAWQECMSKNINLCEKSSDKCAQCIELSDWDFKTQTVVLYNKCNFDCSINKWTIKDEGRKKFTFGDFTLKGLGSVAVIVGNKTDMQNTFYWKDYSYVWTSTGDSLFLRDPEGKLVLWESKGY
jgi:endonuclease YncB( thermonuclease family)